MDLEKILKQIETIFKDHWRKWTILAIGVMIIYLGFVFYQYVYKPVYKTKEAVFQKTEIKQSIYDRVMDTYFQKEKNIEEIFNKNYIDIFR